MTKSAFFGNNQYDLDRVYVQQYRDQITQLCDVHPITITTKNIEEQMPLLEKLEVIFSTWGMFPFSQEQLALLPNLKAVFYAAGTVKGFAVPFLERGITVVSAWVANAVPVAEFTCAQILLANKGFFRNIRDSKSPQTRPNAFRGNGNFGQTIALLGAGVIGTKVIELLRPFNLKVIVFDPFLSNEKSNFLGVKKVELNEAFARGMVVSNHLADVPATKGLLKKEHFSSMQKNAVFINTGRGATVIEDDLISVLRERPDLTALLDVTYPEPPTQDSPFYELPNIFLSGHIAGSIGGEVERMAETMIQEFINWRDAKPLRYAVSLDMLKTMA